MSPAKIKRTEVFVSMARYFAVYQIGIFSADFLKSPQHQTSHPVGTVMIHADRRTDGQEKTNRRFSRLCNRALKSKFIPVVKHQTCR